MVYDAFGKLVAEYGVAAESLGGVKFVQQDWQGSVRTVTNSSGHVVVRTDHQAFGEDIGVGVGLRKVEQGYSADKATRQGYGLTENDSATGQQHTWFRKLETQAGRWTSPDPYKGSMQLGDPQSFNRYAYVSGDPINFVDPSGLCGYTITWTGWSDGTITYTTVWTSSCNVGSGSGGGGGGGGGGGIFGGGVFLPEETLPVEGTEIGGGGGGGGVRQDPNFFLISTDKWYGYKNKTFRDWFHRCYKQPGDPDASKETIEAAYAEWLERGSPTSNNCDGNGGRGKFPAPLAEKARSRKSSPSNSSEFSTAAKVAAGVGTGVLIYVLAKKAAGIGLLFTPAAPAGVVLIATP